MNLSRFCLPLAFGCVVAATGFAADFTPAPQRFLQEVAHHDPVGPGKALPAVQLLDVGQDHAVRSFSEGKWSRYISGKWEEEPALHPKSREEFSFADANGKPVSVALPWAAVKQILHVGVETWLATDADPFLVREGRMTSQGWPSKWRVHQMAASPNGQIFLASSGGLFRRSDRGWENQTILDGLGRAWAVQDVLAVTFDSNGQLWFGTKAGVGCRTDKGWRFFEGKDGLPWNDFTGSAAGPNGEVWFATHLGVLRWDGQDFHYRQGKLWLPDDDARGVAVDQQGRAWIATSGGVGLIERRSMTLSEKAEFYENEIEHYIKRTPFGFTAEAHLRKKADKSSNDPQDSDNDGLWTAMYGAGECFASAATKNPKARVRARQAFEALRFLQKVTQGGSPAPDKGYVARTIRPVEWPDPNTGRIEGDREEQKRDKLWKAYEPRWPKSADGKWFWKSDTSSDELDGHYFFYPLYHDLVADTPEEKARVQEVVRDLTDHLIQHGFTLTDIDGKPTRWAVYGPDTVNGDSRWWPERGLNSLSILTYLTVAAHVTA